MSHILFWNHLTSFLLRIVQQLQIIVNIHIPPQTLFLVADQRLQSDRSFHLDRHLFVFDQILFDQLDSVPQHQLIVETQWAEAVEHPARLPKHSREAQINAKPRHFSSKCLHSVFTPLKPL